MLVDRCVIHKYYYDIGLLNAITSYVVAYFMFNAVCEIQQQKFVSIAAAALIRSFILLLLLRE